MIGAIIGDIIGSIHEFKKPPTKTKDFGPLILKEDSRLKSFFENYQLHQLKNYSHFTDDTICTLAIAQWLLDNRKQDPDFYLRDLCLKYLHFGYGKLFEEWLLNENSGPYNSWGNGAPMRVSPVGWISSTKEEAYFLAEESAKVTHNHPQAIKGAKVIAGIIFTLRKGKNIEGSIFEILSDLDDDGYYNSILNQSLDKIRETYTFKVSAKNSVPQSIVCLLQSNSFEDAIRNAISLGGDADTLAAMTASMAEAIYPIDEKLKNDVFDILDERLNAILRKFQIFQGKLK